MSRTLCICGPPGTGKTATLNFVLSSPALSSEVKRYFYSAMRYPNIKEFLNDFNLELCKEANIIYNPSRVINTLLLNIQLCLDKIDAYK